MQRTIEDVAETLQSKRHSCTLLVGAGCSIDAGIPSAAGFVEAIREKYPQSYRRASQKTYPACMHELAPNQRRALISDAIDAAQVNWAHLGLAQLLKAGYVDRVLTTNFDPLILRACALLGVTPAIYDLAASPYPTNLDFPRPSVFYLHGQHTGIRLMHTEQECQEHSERLVPVFEDAGRARTWIVVGYSGESDPLFEHLAKVEQFENGLYWIGYQEQPPAPRVQERLLVPGKYAFFVNGFDASGFFIGLAQRLGCFPPDLVARPFSHLDAMLSTIAPYRIPTQHTDTEVTEQTRAIVQQAIQHFEAEPSVTGEGKLPMQNSAFVLEVIS